MMDGEPIRKTNADTVLNNGSYLDYCICKEHNMDKNYNEKVNLHAHGYNVSEDRIHPIVFSEELGMH